jgi:hypothetical protein
MTENSRRRPKQPMVRRSWIFKESKGTNCILMSKVGLAPKKSRVSDFSTRDEHSKTVLAASCKAADTTMANAPPGTKKKVQAIRDLRMSKVSRTAHAVDSTASTASSNPVYATTANATAKPTTPVVCSNSNNPFVSELSVPNARSRLESEPSSVRTFSTSTQSHPNNDARPLATVTHNDNVQQPLSVSAAGHSAGRGIPKSRWAFVGRLRFDRV